MTKGDWDSTSMRQGHETQAKPLPMASAGIGYPDARAHAPDENIRLPDFVLGTKHVAAIIEALGEG